ncbi:hypothetical protein DW182_10925, partial [Bacteroides sp. AM16-24]
KASISSDMGAFCIYTPCLSIQFSFSWGKSTCRGEVVGKHMIPINNKNKELFSHLLPWLLFTDRKNI